MAPYLLEGMAVQLSQHDGVPISLVLPQRATFEVIETEPVDQGPDGFVVLQAGGAVQRRAHAGAAAYRRRHARRGDDGRRRVCGAREGLSWTPAVFTTIAQ